MAHGKNMQSKFIEGNSEGPNSPKEGKRSGKGANYAHRDQGKNIPNKGNIGAISRLNKNKPKTDD